jgi:hypothetical protein
MRVRKAKAKGFSSGSALVELAIQLPLYALIFALFFDSIIGYVAKGHSELASLSLLFNFKKTPQLIYNDPVQQLVLIKELDSPQRQNFLENFHSTVVYSLRNAGSFADPKANAAIRMYSLDIDTQTGFVRTDSVEPNLLSEFYTGVTPSQSALDCFGGGTEARTYETELKNFAVETLDQIKSDEAAGIPIGKPLPVFSTGQLNSAPYLAKRTVILYITCYRPVISFFDHKPKISKFVWLPGKEVSWQVE